jgi:hypothetical protein
LLEYGSRRCYRPAMTSDRSPLPALPEHLRQGGEAASAFAEALRRAIAEACPGGHGLRSLARRLDISTTLSASAIRVIEAPDAIAVLAALPGGRGRRSLLRKVGDAGLASEAVEAVRASLERLEAVLEGDGCHQETLQAFVAGSRLSRPNAIRLAEGQRAAFESASQLWGVRLRGLVTSVWIAPSSDGKHCDTAGGQLFLGLARLRPGPTLPICWPPMQTDRGEAFRTDHKSVSALGTVRGPLIEDLGSPALSAEEIDLSPRGVVLFGTPARARDGAIDVAAAFAVPRLGPMYSADPTETGEMNVNCSLPTASLVHEVWLHRELARGGDPAAAYYHIDMRPGDDLGMREQRRAPLHERIVSGAWPLPLPPTLKEGRDRHRLLGERLARHLDARHEDFTGFRIHMRHPSVHTALTLRWRLAPRTE